MDSVIVEKVSLHNYSSIVGEQKIEEIKTLVKDLTGREVCHVNSTSFGGGVAEILHRLVPLMCDVGLKAEWKVIRGSDEFFDVTKTIHNGLQGMNVSLTEQMKEKYLEYNKMNSHELDLNHEFVVIHDNQPAAMINHYPSRVGKWIWRCHIDLSHPNQKFTDFIIPFLLQYDALIFTMEQFVQKPLKAKRVALVTPTIDPLSAKNKPLPQSLILSLLDKYDVDAEKPIITQVARFDPWKDPLGVIGVYRLVKKKMSSVQLLLIASMAKDDPEGWAYYEKTARHAAEDYDIHLLTDLKGVGDVEVNAFQRASDVVVQKSVREGFGLSVAEALWKEVPVVGGNVGGIPLQILHGKTGFLVNSIEEAAEKTLWLLKHPAEAKKMGKQGREHILKNFLITRHLKDYLKLFCSLSKDFLG
jgi:trehalose synthase